MWTQTEQLNFSYPAFLLIQFFGSLLIRFDTEILKISAFGVLCFILKFTANFYEIYLTQNLEADFLNSGSKVLNIVSIIGTVTCIITEFIILTVTLFMQKKIYLCFGEIRKIERELSELGVASGRKNFAWFCYIIKWIILITGNILWSNHSQLFLMFFKAYQYIGYYISLDLFTVLAYMFYENVEKIHDTIVQISDGPVDKSSIKKLNGLIEFTDNFNDYIRSVNHAVGAQVFITIMQMVISLIILIFTLAFTLAGSGMDISSLFLFFMGIFFMHLNLFQLCGVSDLVERKIKDIHTAVRRAYSLHYQKIDQAFLDVNTNVEKFNCGLINFDWSLFTMILSTEIIYLVIMSQFQQMTKATP